MQFLLAAIGGVFSVYPTDFELFVLRAIRPWYLLSDMLVSLIAGLSLGQWGDMETDEA